RETLLNITNYDLTDPTLGIITAAEAGQPNATVLALSRFQRNGAATIATLANQNRYVLYNRTSGFQGGREVRFGVRFVF
ncbi:MAG TPA: hypothetical protein PKE69_01895, partial [Pyrinomonadaceae bacterium]|nr:hypothetical protein [Pyrinomonadaceae bacterium]